MKLSRWFSSSRRTRRLKLQETLPLGDRRLAAILSVDGREFLVGATPQSVSLLGELLPEAEVRTGAPALYTVPPHSAPPAIQ